MKTILSLFALCAVSFAQWTPTPNPGDPIRISSTLALPTTDCLFIYYMNEGTGTTTADSCAGNTGTFVNGHTPTWATGGGIQFTGDERISTGSFAGWGSIQTFLVAYEIDQTSLSNSSALGYSVIASGSSNQPMFNFYPSNLSLGLSATSLGLYTQGAIKNVGPTIGVMTLGNPNLIYVNGQAIPGYLAQGTAGLSAGDGTMVIGNYQALYGLGFRGKIYAMAGYSTVKSASWVATNTAILASILQSRGISVGDRNATSAQWISDGDSISTGGPNVTARNQMYQFFAQKLMPLNFNWHDTGVGGKTANSCNLTAATIVDPITARYISNGVVVASLEAGTNDIVAGGTGATTYTSIQSWHTARQATGAKTVATTILPRNTGGSFNTNRNAANASIMAGALDGTLATNAVSYWGNDPNMGQDSQYSTTWYGDGIHPSVIGYGLGGFYFAPAVMAAVAPGTPVYLKFSVSNSTNVNWTLNPNGAGVGPGAAISAATTQAVPLYFLGPKYKLCGVTLKTTTAFTATGLASLTATIGDSVGGNTYYTSSAYNLMTAVGNTNFQDTKLLSSATWAGSNVTLFLTANQNLNAQSNLAGAVDVTLCVTSIP